MSKELTFTYRGRRITARQTGTLTPSVMAGPPSVTPHTHEIIEFKEDDGNFLLAPIPRGEFETLELPRDLQKLQRWHDEAE